MERVADKSPEETEARFWGFVEVEGDCWIWKSVRRRGYGRFKLRGRYHEAHRFAWQLLVGPIPEGMTLDHYACIDRACVNPDHLEVVTLGENTARGNRRVRYRGAAKRR